MILHLPSITYVYYLYNIYIIIHLVARYYLSIYLVQPLYYFIIVN